MEDDNKASFIVVVQNDELTIDTVMKDILEDFMPDDELIIVLNNSTDSSESKIDKYLPKLPNTYTKIIHADSREDNAFDIKEALEVGKENSSNDLNFIIYGTEYSPVEWTKDE